MNQATHTYLYGSQNNIIFYFEHKKNESLLSLAEAFKMIIAMGTSSVICIQGLTYFVMKKKKQFYTKVLLTLT